MANAAMATSPKRFMVRSKNIPELVRQFDEWVLWRYEPNPDPKKKSLKVPYYINGRKRTNSTGSDKDRVRLAPFADALAAAKSEGYDGVGLAIMPEHNITILDIDDCINEDGAFSEFATEVINSGTYVEVTPSGRGLHALYTGALIDNTKANFHIENGERIEVYCGSAYLTFTGNTVEGSEDPIDMPKSIARKLTAAMGSRNRVSSDGESEGIASMNARPLPNMTTAQAAKVLKGLPPNWGESGEGNWYQVAAALHMQFDGSEEAYAVLDEWSSQHSGYDEESNRARWDVGFSHARGKQNVTSMKNIVFEAQKGRDKGSAKISRETLESWGLARKPKAERDPDEAISGTTGIELDSDEASEEIQQAWTPIAKDGWLGAAERPEGTPTLIPHWLTDENVTLFSSTGGSGKSFIALTLLAFAADGTQEWFGEPMVPGRALFVSGEDPAKDIKARLWAICAKYKLDVEKVEKDLDIVDVSDLLVKSLYDAGDYGKSDFTKQYFLLEKLLETGGYKYVVLDNVSEFFGGNENARNQVVPFVGSIRRCAARSKMGIVLIGHTAKAGESEFSGSTAWHNSTRVRWVLSSNDAGVRTLSVGRITHGKQGKAGRWDWDGDHGLIVMGSACGEGSAASEFGDIALDSAVFDFIAASTDEGGRAPCSKNAPLGAIEACPEVLEAGGDKHSIRDAFVRLESLGRIKRVEYQTRGRKTKTGYAVAEDLDPING